jgi:hypothetical protein
MNTRDKYVGALLVAAVLAPAQASAEWEYVIESATDMYFADRSTIKKQGKYTLMWQLTNSVPSASPEEVKSRKTLLIYDCATKTYGSKAHLYYSGYMGSGEVIDSEFLSVEEVEFIDLVPDSVGQDVFKIACGKAK